MVSVLRSHLPRHEDFSVVYEKMSRRGGSATHRLVRPTRQVKQRSESERLGVFLVLPATVSNRDEHRRLLEVVALELCRTKETKQLRAVRHCNGVARCGYTAVFATIGYSKSTPLHQQHDRDDKPPAHV